MFRTPPSRLLSIQNDYEAYCLDEAVFLFGSSVEAKLHEIGTKNQNPKTAEARMEETLKNLLSGGSGFADPASLSQEELSKGR